MPCGKECLTSFLIVWAPCLPSLMKILFLSRWFPFPANNGSKIRIYHLLKGLSQFHDVTLFSFYDPDTESADHKDTNLFCSQVQLVPWKPFNEKSGKAILGFLSVTPRSLIDTYSYQMESLIRAAVSGPEYDLIIASQLSMASYYSAFGDVPAIFEEIELGLFLDQIQKTGNWIVQLRRKLSWFKLEKYYSRLLDFFAACTVVSDREQHILTEHFPRHANKIEVLPNCIEADNYQSLHVEIRPHTIIFSGSFNYRPNYHAMQWFTREVFPLILEQIPDAHLVITGDHANLPLPQTKNVTLTGYVNDVKSLMASCSVSLAPLWTGGGTRLKILEAMAVGIPVVATSKGAEGLHVEHGKHILIADQPETFAQCVINLLCDEDLRTSLSSNALHLVKENYDWKIVMPKFLSLLENVIAG